MTREHYDREAVRGAIVREGLSLLAHGALFPFGMRKARPAVVAGREPHTIVFIHGLGANRSGFLPLRAYLRLHGHTLQRSFDYRSRGSVERLARNLKRALDGEVRGGRISLVAHSMGGLVARCYLQQLGGARRVDRLVTLGTPHRGTHAANFVPAALVRQLLPDAPFIRRLNALPALDGVDVTSITAGRDVLVQPTDAARCPFGQQRHFPELGHVELLFRPEVFAAVHAALGQVADPATPAGPPGRRARPPSSRR